MENWSRTFWYIKPHRLLILLRSSESYRSKWFGYNRYVLLHQLDLCFPGPSGISWGLSPSFLPLSLWLQSCTNRWLKAEKLHHHRKAGSGSHYGSALLRGVGNWTSPLLTCAKLLTSVAEPLKPSPRAYRALPTWYTSHRQLASFPALEGGGEAGQFLVRGRCISLLQGQTAPLASVISARPTLPVLTVY